MCSTSCMSYFWQLKAVSSLCNYPLDCFLFINSMYTTSLFNLFDELLFHHGLKSELAFNLFIQNTFPDVMNDSLMGGLNSNAYCL